MSSNLLKGLSFPQEYELLLQYFCKSNTISSLYIPNQGKLNPLRIYQKINKWSFEGYIKELGPYFKKMGNAEGTGAG